MKLKSSPYILMVLALGIFAGCSKDDNGNDPVIVDSKVYQLTEVNGSGVTGKAKFTKDDSGNTEVLIELDGSTTSSHPAFIRYNTAAQGGDVALTLKSCECNVGHTTVTKLDNGEPITFEGLLELNGHVSIHASPNDLGSVVASANIGMNAQ